MKKFISILLAALLILSMLVMTVSAEVNIKRSTSELVGAIPSSDGAVADGIYYDLYRNFTEDPNGFISDLDELDSVTRTMVIETLSRYCIGDLKGTFEAAIDKLDPSTTAEALTSYFNSVKNTYQENIRTDIYMPQYDLATIKQAVEANKAIGFVYDEEYFDLLTKVYNADTNIFARAISNLSSTDFNKIAFGMTATCTKTGTILLADYTKGGGLTTAEAVKMTAFDTTLSTMAEIAKSEDALKSTAIEIFNADVITESASYENGQISVFGAPPVFENISWIGLNVNSTSTRLNVTIDDTDNRGATRSYYLRVYCYSGSTGQWWLKHSGYKVSLPSAVAKVTAAIPIVFSSAGTIQTKVEIWNATNSALLRTAQKPSSDVVKGEWRINVDLPTNRFREGALGVYNASGELVLPIMRCLGRSESNASMGTTYGNTPVGNNYAVLGAPEPNTISYGPYKVVKLTAMPGHPYPNRTGIWIHGGQNQTSLTATYGCIRVFNNDQLAIQNKLENLMLYANGHNTTGTVIVSEKSYLD